MGVDNHISLPTILMMKYVTVPVFQISPCSVEVLRRKGMLSGWFWVRKIRNGWEVNGQKRNCGTEFGKDHSLKVTKVGLKV